MQLIKELSEEDALFSAKVYLSVFKKTQVSCAGEEDIV
jgi:hypothetical protein